MLYYLPPLFPYSFTLKTNPPTLSSHFFTMDLTIYNSLFPKMSYLLAYATLYV